MKTHKKYLTQAEKLVNANFFMGGVGSFNLSTQEIAYVLFLINNQKWEELEDFYNKLHLGVFGWN